MVRRLAVYPHLARLGPSSRVRFRDTPYGYPASTHSLTSRREPYPRLASNWSRRRIGVSIWALWGLQINKRLQANRPIVQELTRQHDRLLGCLTFTTIYGSLGI